MNKQQQHYSDDADGEQAARSTSPERSIYYPFDATSFDYTIRPESKFSIAQYPIRSQTANRFGAF
jgi:hypothetical protein